MEPEIFDLKKTLVLTVGLPASGKTTWALSAGFDCTISLDDCRKKLWGADTVQNGPGGFPVILRCMMEELRAAMRENKSIVVHNTNILKKYRRPVIELAKAAGYRVWIVFFDVSPDECVRRNKKRTDPVPEKVIREFYGALEVPEPGEADGVEVLRFG